MRTKIIFCLAILLIPSSILAYEIYWIGNPPIKRAATNKPYEEIELDSIQECIIKSELDMSEVYGSMGTESELAGLCIRAFSVWVRKYTEDKDLQVKVFSLSRGFRNESLLSPDEFSEDYYDEEEAEDDEEEDDKEWEQERKEAKEYYEKVPFDFIKPYQEYNLDSLISRKAALINVESYYFTAFSNINVRINALFPNREDNNSYIQKNILYRFVLKISPEKQSIFVNNIIIDPNYLFDTDNSIHTYPLEVNGYWDLLELSEVGKTIKYTEKDLPKTLYELFFDSK